MRFFLFVLACLISSSTVALSQRDEHFGSSPEALISAGGKFLTKGEVVQLLTNRTEMWDTGGRAYYGAGGKLSLWFGGDGRADGSWQVSGNGTMCTKANRLPKWSNYCHRYISYKGKIYYVWRGKINAIQRTKSGKAF